MAVEDLFKTLQLVNKTLVSTSDGWKYVYTAGSTFSGRALKKGASAQTNASLLGNDKIQYQLSTFASNTIALPQGQIFRWKEVEQGEWQYAVVLRPDNVSPAGSAIEDIQVFDAESFIMPEELA